MEEHVTIENFVENFNKLISNEKEFRFYGDYFPSEDNLRKIYQNSFLRENNETIAFFIYKPTLKINSKDFWESAPPSTIHLKYFVFSNGITHIIYKPNRKKVTQFDNINELYNFLIIKPTSSQIRHKKDQITTVIEESVKNFFTDFFDKSHSLYIKKDVILKHFNKSSIRKNILYDKTENFFHISSDIRKIDNFENIFFKILIDNIASGELIHRYTTLETVFATIKNASIRLNGITGMNDISEIGYVEAYLDENFIPLNTGEDLDEINKKFILCSSLLPDDLLEWRLYGDDSKGACLVFAINDRNKIPGVQIRRINYGIRNNDGNNYHPELELLLKISKNILANTGEVFRFRTLTIWKHFFKSFEYQPEEEARLLIIISKNNNLKGEIITVDNLHDIKKEWGLTASHKILTPFIYMDMRDAALPLELKKIVLGPKFPENIINKRQFEQLLAEIRLTATVEISRIKNYR